MWLVVIVDGRGEGEGNVDAAIHFLGFGLFFQVLKSNLNLKTLTSPQYYNKFEYDYHRVIYFTARAWSLL